MFRYGPYYDCSWVVELVHVIQWKLKWIPNYVRCTCRVWTIGRSIFDFICWKMVNRKGASLTLFTINPEIRLRGLRNSVLQLTAAFEYLKTIRFGSSFAVYYNQRTRNLRKWVRMYRSSLCAHTCDTNFNWNEKISEHSDEMHKRNGYFTNCESHTAKQMKIAFVIHFSCSILHRIPEININNKWFYADENIFIGREKSYAYAGEYWTV